MELWKSYKIEQIYHHYSVWEDWQNGFYENTRCEHRTEKSRELLSDRKKCRDYMKRVINEWPKSAEQNLTNKSINKQAWLGQAACNLSHKASFLETIDGWNRMKPLDQFLANNDADDVLKIFKWKLSHGEEIF